MLENIASSDILSSHSINAVPALFAEWNYNLFSSPYLTTAGSGTKISFDSPTPTPSTSTTVVKENFTTKSITTGGMTTKIQYPKASGLGGNAYKIVTYVKTNSSFPVILNAHAVSSFAHGSFSEEVSSIGWKRIELVIGLDSAINDLIFVMNFSSKNAVDTGYTVYFTDPEMYETTSFDYYNGNLWTTQSPFTYFRPGESYIGTGNKDISFPDNHRRIASQLYYQETSSGGFYGNKYMPVSRVMCNPKSIVLNNPAAYSGSATAYQNPLLKNGMISDMMPYKYFVSEETNKKITALYEKDIYVNKIVLKFNAMIYKPTLSVTIGTTTLTNQTPDANGILVLYWDGTTWSSTKKWTRETPVPGSSVAMPSFNADGDIVLKTAIKKITIEQTGQTIVDQFNNSYFTIPEFQRMNLIECSPRLEVDLSNFVTSFNINKSMDNGASDLPVSLIDANDASFSLSNIPVYSLTRGTVPIFSNESTNQYSVLSKMLVKNVKLYSYLHVKNASTLNDVNNYTNNYVPLGVFFTDSWGYDSDTTMTIQSFDILRYLQTISVVDYAAQLLSVEDIVTNILDFVGFTDYDYDSLLQITQDDSVNMDLAYYFANSKDKTVFDALRELFLSYQITAYIDEYGIMKFKSLPKMITDQTVDITLNDFHIVDEGYTVENKSKPGKMVMSYSSPKIKQSASLQNVKDLSVTLSPSFTLTTQNDVVWQQQNYDSVGFNYLQMPAGETMAMSKDADKFRLKVADLLDIFYTYSRDYDGYAFIEDEAVSFKYKEYTISQISNPANQISVSVKNDFELKAKINQFVKKYRVGLGSEIDLDGNKNPSDILVEPTGYITNVRRGMFGTKVRDHQIINTNLASKTLEENFFNGTFSPSVNTIIEENKIKVTENNGNTVYIFPSVERDEGYKTYSMTFTPFIEGSPKAGIFFNCPASQSSLDGTYKVELEYNETSVRYYIKVSQNTSGVWNLLYLADVTKIAQTVYDNVPQVYKLNAAYTEGMTLLKKYQSSRDRVYNLKVVHMEDDPLVGNIDTNNPGEEILRIYLNGVEIKQWSMFDGTNVTASSIISTNALKLPRSPIIPTTVTEGTIFGVTFTGNPESATAESAYIREIYACTEALAEPTDFYFHKTQYFLSSLAAGRLIPYKSYMMQTNPSASGLNYYDVQYTTPAATVVDVLPVKYLLVYQPTDYPADVWYRQKLTVLENAAKYSCPVNTGFRSKMLIANNSPMTVFLNRDADSTALATVRLNLWTHQIIAMSDKEVIEFDLDKTNMSETIQIESDWIQSSDSAYSILNTVGSTIDNFSVNTTLTLFGNPLIQVGDVVSLTYPMAGVSNKSYLVKEVSQQFDNGLSTTIKISRL